MNRLILFMAVLLCARSLSEAQTSVDGAGSTFVYPIMARWINEYEKTHPGVHIGYLAAGSGVGIAQTLKGMVDFGATDAPLTDHQIAEGRVKVLHIPVILGADVAAYNVSGVKTDLRLSPRILADIFLGNIKKWNDKAIAAANPGITFPDKDIIVVHRHDGSGTTYIWADYLCKVSPEWNEKVGRGTTVNWPVQGLDGNGNEGVAKVIRDTDGAIGYLELAFAVKNNISFASVQNSAGVFIQPTIKSTSVAADSIKAIPADLRMSLTDAPGGDSYPIVSLSWVLVPVSLRGTAKGKTIADFLSWVVTDGQKFATELQYAPLPAALSSQAKAAIDQVR